MTTNTPKFKDLVPWTGILAGLAGIVFCLAMSALVWPDMAGSIVTREAGGNHGTSVVSREFTAAAMPVTLAVLVALVSVAPALDEKLLGRLPFNRGRSPRNAVRVLNYVLPGITVLLVVLHLGLLSEHTGSAFPLMEAMAEATGLILLLLGISLPLARPEGRYRHRELVEFRDSLGSTYRLGGFSMAAIGLGVMVLAFIIPTIAMVVATAGIVFTFGGMLILGAVRMRS